MQATYLKIHPKFKLNGVSYTSLQLKEVGCSLVREGEPFEQAIGDFLLNWLDDKSVVDVKTSGSTGKLKIIALQKQHMVNSALATANLFGLQEGTTALLCLPVDFIAGKMMLVRAMVSGFELDYVEPSSNPSGESLKNYDFAAMVPLQLENSLEQINKIKVLIVGGAPISSALLDKLQDKTTQIFETYGMTETITHIAIKKANQGIENTFRTLPNVLVSKDDRNCLVINAPKISDVPVVTNDIVKLVSDTEFEWLGRYDNIINSGGVKLVPELIESKLAPLIENRFFVAGIPDEKLGQQLVLVVEGEINSEALLKKIKASAALDRFEIPKGVLTAPKFKETANGKILRGETWGLVYDRFSL